MATERCKNDIYSPLLPLEQRRPDNCGQQLREQQWTPETSIF